jgi:phosphoglycerate dehydrogenase-like enzyme
LLAGKTVLLLGYGHIGQHVAQVCQALEMKVLAIRRNPGAPIPAPVGVYPPSALRDLLPQANILVVALPLTPETRGLIGAAELALLRPPAMLVNVGRGPIVDEAALYEALRSGRLHAAGLDVWYSYPTDTASRARTPPSRFPFHELKNVVMTPHYIANNSENDRRFVAELAAMLNTAARGEPLPNRVDVWAGY